MKTLEFTAEEIELLRDLLQHTVHDMDLEVCRTDTREFKERLKHRRDVLDHVLMKLGTAPVPV